MDRDAMKRAAAVAAVDEVRDAMVLGLGTGSTAAHAVAEIGARLADGRLNDIVGVPTSQATAMQAESLGIRLLEPGEARIDLTIDGADEITETLDLTKGGGGALLREKIVGASGADYIVIADDSKLVAALGSTFRIPLEIARFGHRITVAALAEAGRPHLRGGSDPFVTDNGNYIVDLETDPIEDPADFDNALHAVPGVLATGLFVGIARRAVLGGPGGLRVIDG